MHVQKWALTPYHSGTFCGSLFEWQHCSSPAVAREELSDSCLRPSENSISSWTANALREPELVIRACYQHAVSSAEVNFGYL